MTREPIFDLDINRITEQKLTDILLMASSIRQEHYSNFTEIFKNNPQISSVLVSCRDGSEKFWNNFFTIFQNENGELNIDPSKIVLSGELDKFDLDIYENIENLILSEKQIKDSSKIISKFPNLKNIKIPDSNISFADMGDDINNIFNVMNYMKFGNLKGDLAPKDIQDFIDENNLNDKFLLSSDGRCLINLDKIDEKSFEPETISVNVADIEKIGIDRLKKSGDKVTLVINNASELSNQQLQEYENAGLQIEGIKVFSPENSREQNEVYDIGTYSAIRDKLEEIVEGIDVNLPDKQRFAEVYKRVCSNIAYDTPAGYPKTNAEIKYSNLENANCRNLRNGLLEGKCVCAGYADILRNALAMVNIDAKYIKGFVVDKTISDKKFKDKEIDKGYIEKKEDGTVLIGEYHAWNKVKLDGAWYNVAPTWDATQIRLGQVPTNCLETDEEIRKNYRKTEFDGPECNTSIEKKELDQIFNNKHLYLGNVRLPNVKDVFATIKAVGELYVDLGRDIKKGIINIKDKILSATNMDKPLKLNSTNSKRENSNEEHNGWDLSNWGIKTNEFQEETKSIVEKSKNQITTNTNKDKNYDENEK